MPSPSDGLNEKNNCDFGPELNKLLQLFKDHMTGPFRGRKEKSVATVLGDVKRILRYLCIKDDLNPVIKSDTLLLKYMRYCREKNHLQGTIKTYLGSFIDFLQVLAQCKCHHLDVRDIIQTEKLILQWKKSFTKAKSYENTRGTLKTEK